MARLKEKYNTEIVSQLMAKFSYSSVMQVPRVQKVVINMGLGEAIQNVKILESAQKELGDRLPTSAIPMSHHTSDTPKQGRAGDSQKINAIV